MVLSKLQKEFSYLDVPKSGRLQLPLEVQGIELERVLAGVEGDAELRLP